MKCCGTCNKVMDIDVEDKLLCLLVDEPVDFNEYCNSWSNKE